MATHDNFEYDGDNSAVDVLKWAIEKFHPYITISCSFEQPVTAHMALTINPDVKIFSIDTGRLPEETYECATEFEKRFSPNIEWYFPKKEEVEKLVNEKGMYSFRESLNARKECCGIRKVEPLRRQLNTLDAWVTGQRKDQSPGTRNDVPVVQLDDAFEGRNGELVKFNPLANWSSKDVWDYIRISEAPYNRLHERGFVSIGGEPCTRPVLPGQHEREGRWWWEEATQKECGLHAGNLIASDV